MNDKTKNPTDTIHYILTFFAFILIIVCFLTPLITKKPPALIQFDSLAGSILLGSIFLLYAGWFVYQDCIEKEFTLSQSIAANTKKNTATICILLYWIVLVIIPMLFNLF